MAPRIRSFSTAPSIRTRRRRPFPEGSPLAVLDELVGHLLLKLRADEDSDNARLRRAIADALEIIDEALQ